MSLDTNNTFFQPLTLDGLTTISADNLNLNVDAGLLQADSLGDVYGSTNISFEPSIQGVTMTNFIRNAITGSAFVDYDKNTGVISLSGGVASKWTFDTTANVIYPAVSTTGIVAMNNLVVSGGASMNNNLTVSKLIGIGTDTPAVRLHVVTGAQTIAELLRMSNGTATIYSGVDNSNGPWFGTSSAHNLRLVTNGSQRVIIDTAGNVGIGVTPTAPLSFASSTGRKINLYSDTYAIGVESNELRYASNGFHAWRTGGYVGTERMRLDANGNLGIGSTPNYKLHVKGDALFVESTSSANPAQIIMSVDTATNKSGSIDYLTSGDMKISNNFTTGKLISTNDISLPKGSTTGRKISFDYGSTNAGATDQGILWTDLTTSSGQLAIYGFQNTLNFVAGGSQKMTIGANVDFATVPYVSGSQIDTTDVLEVGNLYFTTERARQSISASSPLSYDNSTGIMSLGSSAISKWASGANNTIYNLNTTGSVSMSAMVVSGNATFGNSSITVSGAINISGSFMITGNATFNNVISVSANVLVGTASIESNVLISARKSGGAKIKVSSSSGADAELWMANTVGSYSLYSHNSVNSCRLYNYGTGKDLLTVLSNGNLGIGNQNPQFLLSLSANTDTTAHIKSNSTTGFSQVFLQCDGLVGGGLVLYGSANASSNALAVQNNVGNIYINPVSFATINGNCGIGGDPASALCVRGSANRTDTNVAGVHACYSSNTPIITLVSETSNEIGTINFGYKGTATTNGTILYDHYANSMRFLTNGNTRMTITGNGRVHINSSSQLSTYAGDMLNVKGRVLIAGYDGSDVNPVITFKDNGANFHYFYFNGICSTPGSVANAGFVMSDYLGIGKQPVYQIDLSTDYARKLTSIYWSVVSDRRLKENIEDANLDICYENIKKLKLHRYNYIDEFGKDENGVKQYGDNRQLGWISQEAIELFPKSVKITNNIENGGLEDEMALDADQIMKSLYGAVQKLIQKVENLEETIIKERIQYKAMKQKQDALITKQGVLIECMKKALLMRGITI